MLILLKWLDLHLHEISLYLKRCNVYKTHKQNTFDADPPSLITSFCLATFRCWALDRYRLASEFISHASKSSSCSTFDHVFGRLPLYLASLNIFFCLLNCFTVLSFSSFAVFKILFCRLVYKFNFHKALYNSNKVGT